MSKARWIKCVLILSSTCAIASEPPPKTPTDPVARAEPARRSPLAERLARSEAMGRALDRQMATVAAKKTSAANAKVVERVRRFRRRRVRVVAWREYVRTVPGVVVEKEYINNTGAGAVRLVADQNEAERAVAAMGNDLEAMWAKRKQVEAERLILWAKIAFRAVADKELSDQPLYRFTLKGQGEKGTSDQQIQAVEAAAQFVRVVDHLSDQAAEGVDAYPAAVFSAWHKLLAESRRKMQDTLLGESALALDVNRPQTLLGHLSESAKKLVELARSLDDAQKALAAADKAEDDEQADAARAQVQQILAKTTEAVIDLDKAVGQTASTWSVSVVPGTRAAGDLPDLGMAKIALTAASSVEARQPTVPGLALDQLKNVDVAADGTLTSGSQAQLSLSDTEGKDFTIEGKVFLDSVVKEGGVEF